MATAVASYIGRFLIGTHPSFYVPALEVPDFYLTRPGALATFFVLGGLMGLLSVAFIKGLYRMEDLFDALPGNYYTRHMLGMLCVGVMMYLLLLHAGHYYVDGVGYATVMDILSGALSDPWFLLMLVALKLLATCLSLGSGASGGVFSPALFLGAAGGAAFGTLCHSLFPGLDIDLATFAIAGMAAMIGGTTGAILTGMIMLTEMTRDNSVILPLIIACSIAYAVRKAIMNESIYTAKLLAHGHSVPEGLEAAVMTTYRVGDLMGTDFAVSGTDGDPPSWRAITVRSEGGRIDRVSARADIGGGTGGASQASSIPYTVSGERTTLLAAVTAMWASEARVILVSRDPGAGRAEDIVGVVTTTEIARFLSAKDELL